MTAALEVRGLGYELPGRGKRNEGRVLVQDVSFTVAAGETLVLLGRSGSGKTTTLKLINRLLEPTAGEVVMTGERAAGVPATQLRHHDLAGGGLEQPVDELQGRGLPRS